MSQPGPMQRVQGRYFVIAPETVLPQICVRTGKRDDLVEVEEDTHASRLGVPRAVERAVGGIGALWAHEQARVRYWINREELERLRRWRKYCERGILAGLGLLALGLVLRSAPVAAPGFFIVCAGVAIYRLLPAPLSVAAVWGGQIFLLKVPRAIVDATMRPSPHP